MSKANITSRIKSIVRKPQNAQKSNVFTKSVKLSERGARERVQRCVQMSNLIWRISIVSSFRGTMSAADFEKSGACAALRCRMSFHLANKERLIGPRGRVTIINTSTTRPKGVAIRRPSRVQLPRWTIVRKQSEPFLHTCDLRLYKHGLPRPQIGALSCPEERRCHRVSGHKEARWTVTKST